VTQVEVHHRAVRRVDGATLLLLVHERLGDPVARAELHASHHRRGRRRAQVVVLQVAVAVLVEQPAALGPSGLGDQDAGERQTGRVVLDELHVLQRRPGPVRECHPVAGLDVAVRRVREHPPAAAGAQDHGPARNRLDPPGGQLDADDALHAVLVDQQRGHVPLVVAGDLLVLQRRLEQRVQQVEAGLVRREPGALLLHAPERADRDLAVGRSAPRAAPVLELHQLDRRLHHERLDRVLVAQPVTAGHRVVGVLVQAVVPRDDRRRAALGRDRMAAHRIDLRHDRDAQAGVRLHDRDGRA
jgi:hypothetical protein